MGKRRKSRELALQWLYQMDLTGMTAEEVLAQVSAQEDEEESVPDSPEVRDFAATLIRGVREHRGALDPIISEFAAGWTIDRMAILDRNILRLALFEIQCLPDMPHRVSINEAVELAKTYSTAESGRFVNGILGNFVRARGITKLDPGEKDDEREVAER